LAEYLKAGRDLGIDLIGFFDDNLLSDDRLGRVPPRIAGVPVLGTTDDMVAMIRANEIDAVLLALPWAAAQRIEDIVRRVATMPVSVGLAPDMVAFQFPHRAVRSLGGLPILQVCEQRLSYWFVLVKRLEDVMLATAMLLLLALPMAAIAIAIKLDTPGPVLFSQRRYGLGNAIFRVHKFRTMHTHLTDADCQQQTVRQDPRLTRVGAVLRRFSLDELPQLFNVLDGEMSIVGPRPHALSTKAEGRLFEDAVATYMARHRVKPGITGLAQVNGWRGETDTLEKIVRRVEHDLYYIGNWSLALDLMIVLRTVKIVYKDANAY
jgi:Undecaprenyl-phosphate glucose phosphotransferase